MKLRPLHDKVLVERTEEEKTSAGGIILSGTATEKPSQGVVIAVGPGKKNDWRSYANWSQHRRFSYLWSLWWK